MDSQGDEISISYGSDMMANKKQFIVDKMVDFLKENDPDYGSTNIKTLLDLVADAIEIYQRDNNVELR